MKSKVCRACKTRKSVKSFYVKEKSKDGYQTWCKDCQVAYDRKRRAKVKRRKAKLKALDQNIQKANSVIGTWKKDIDTWKRKAKKAVSKAMLMQASEDARKAMAAEEDKKVFKVLHEAAGKRRRGWTMKAYSVPVEVQEPVPTAVGEWVADAFLGKSNAEVVMPIGMRVFGEMVLCADGRVTLKVDDDQGNTSTVTLHWKQKA
jgi:hypothetical protein